MTQVLSDGTVIPSHLRLASPMRYRTGQFSNLALRVGEVKEVLYPDDERSLSKQFTEYVVTVQLKDGAGVGVPVVYPNCVVAQLFGGTADYFNYTLRADDGQNVDPDTGLGNGSIVLLLCLNGETQRPFIVGGFPINPQDDLAANEHNLHFRFNGIDVTVNKDGELAVSFTGVTAADGTLAEGVDAKASGNKLLFSKDGSVSVTSPDGKQSLKLDHTAHKQFVVADTQYKVTCTAGNVIILSKGVLIGDATDFFILGTTYRKAEGQLNAKLSAALATINSALGAAAGALQGAASMFSMGPAGNIPAAGPIATAGSSIQAASVAAAQAKAALDAFEGNAPSYLSKKNKSD